MPCYAKAANASALPFILDNCPLLNNLSLREFIWIAGIGLHSELQHLIRQTALGGML